VDSDDSRIYIHRNTRRLHDSIRVNAGPNEFKMEIQPVGVQVFDLVIMVGIPAFIGITLAGFFRFVPPESMVWPIGFVYVLISAVVLLIVAHLTIHPQLSVVVNSPSVQTVINLPGLSIHGTNTPILTNYSGLWKGSKRTVLIRVSFIMLGVIIGVLYALLA